MGGLIEVLLAFPSQGSPVDTPLFHALERAAREHAQHAGNPASRLRRLPCKSGLARDRSPYVTPPPAPCQDEWASFILRHPGIRRANIRGPQVTSCFPVVPG